MPVSFLDLTPKPPTATVTIATTDGPQAIELTGVPLRALVDISTRFPTFGKVLEGGAGSLMDNPEALAALIAAALGHPGNKDYEKHVAGFPSGDTLAMGIAVINLTFSQATADPLLPAGANGAGAAEPVPTLPSQLNS